MNDISLSPIHFLSVTVNGRGQIIHRQTHTATQFSEQLSGGITLDEDYFGFRIALGMS